MGQAAYLSQHHSVETDYRIGFYVSVPGRCTNLLVHWRQVIYLTVKGIQPLSLCFRENKMARSCDRHFSRGGRKSSCHYRNFLDNKTVLCLRLLSEGQNCTYLLKDPRSDLYTGDQLDVDALMLGYYWWLSRHETNGQCIRYNFHMNDFLHFSSHSSLDFCFCCNC